jgi:CrcB protein
LTPKLTFGKVRARQWSLPSPLKAGKTARANDSFQTEGVFLMLDYILVMLGGALGTGARFWASGFVAEKAGELFPLGTLVVNVTGSFAIGFFAAFTDPEGPLLVSPRLRQFFMIGVCGGYTTFSSFSLQTLDLVRDGDWFKAFLNTVLSFACCVAAVWLGRILALALLQK